MRIIIYGLGRGLEYIEQNLKKEHEIIGYSDSFATISVFKGKPFYVPKRLGEIDFDYLVIAVRDRKTAYHIYEMLTGEYGLEKDKVIPFYVYANGELWDYCMAHADVENVEGLIFGTSYAQHGILTDYLSANFENLAVPSTDLYATLETFRACIDKYGNKLKKLKYIIIDMFDYNYFNFDASLCRVFFTHILYGGIMKKHNYAKSCNYKKSFEEDMFEYGGMKVDSTEKLKELFVESYALERPLEPYSRYNCVGSDTPLPIGHFRSRVIHSRDEKVIKENICNLETLLKEIFQFNPDMKVILCLLPKFITLEETKQEFMKEWEKEFNDILKDVTLHPNVYLFNYKFREGIYDNNRLWYDVGHLNTVGAKCMTSIIEEDLQREIYI